MCRNCWQEHGAPTEDSPEIQRVVALIRELYATEPVGGPLHVELDDWNIEGEWKLWGSREDLNHPLAWDVAAEIAGRMKKMSISARASALARADGYIMKTFGAWVKVAFLVELSEDDAKAEQGFDRVVREITHRVGEIRGVDADSVSVDTAGY